MEWQIGPNICSKGKMTYKQPKTSDIVAVDFDGTIVDGIFPSIGQMKPNALFVLTSIQKLGYRLILWTCREDHVSDPRQQYLTTALEYCTDHGLEFDAVNTFIPRHEFPADAYKYVRKPFADWYIDDHTPLYDIDWEKLGQFFGVM